MLKRGQITIFLVIGIVILLLAALFFYIFGQIKEAPLEVEAKEAQKIPGVRGTLQSYVENCIQETVDPAIYLLAIQGGVIYPDEDGKILLTDYGIVNYAWLNGVNGLSREKMETDLARYLEENIDFCFRGFPTFLQQNIIVIADYGKIDATVNIKKSALEAELNLPIEIIFKKGDKQSFEQFSTQLQSGLGTLIETVESLEFPDPDPNHLLEFPYQPVVFPFDESVVIYSLSSNNPEEPLNFVFAVRNDFPENEPPQLAFIPDKTFRIGDRWQEELTADDPNEDILRYSSDSDQFTIAEDGTIDVEITIAGIFDVTFTVEDVRGGKDEQQVSILVLEK